MTSAHSRNTGSHPSSNLRLSFKFSQYLISQYRDKRFVKTMAEFKLRDWSLVDEKVERLGDFSNMFGMGKFPFESIANATSRVG